MNFPLRSRGVVLLAAGALIATHVQSQTFYTLAKAAPPFGGKVLIHKNTISQGTVTKPGYLQTIVDPVYGCKITRITGDPGTLIKNIGGTWGTTCRNNYQKDPVWNADESLMKLTWKCSILLDGKTYEPIGSPGGAGESRWHPTDPAVMICLSGNRLISYNVKTKQSTTLETFAGYSGLRYELEGGLSGDGNWIAPSGTDASGKAVCFAYDIKNRKKYVDIPEPPSLDWATISFTGKYVILNGNYCNDPTGGTTSDRLGIYESTTGKLVNTVKCDYGLPSHQDFTIDENGDDVVVGVAKSGTYAWNTCIMRRLSDDKITPLSPSGSHTGCRNTSRPGWAYIQRAGSGYCKGEVIAVQCKWTNNIVERLGYIPNTGSNYSSQSYGAVSTTGTRFCAGADWGDASGPIQSYVVDVRDIISPTAAQYYKPQIKPAGYFDVTIGSGRGFIFVHAPRLESAFKGAVYSVDGRKIASFRGRAGEKDYRVDIGSVSNRICLVILDTGREIIKQRFSPGVIRLDSALDGYLL